MHIMLFMDEKQMFFGWFCGIIFYGLFNIYAYGVVADLNVPTYQGTSFIN
jgi:hypothetical protein